jgi:glycosyltransferase involved in cell wall biosynthesis
MPVDLFLYPSYLINESRIYKMTKSLIKERISEKIHVVGVWKNGLASNEKIADEIEYFRLKTKIYKYFPIGKTLIYRWEWYLKILIKYLNKNVRVIQCSSIEDLPIGIILKFLKKDVKVVYDAYELETEKTTLKGIRKIWYKIMERILIKYVDKVSLVSKSIVDWYIREYNIQDKVFLIRNIPYNYYLYNKESANSNKKILRQTFSIKDEDILFIYQGALIHGRSIMTLLEVFQQIQSQQKHIVFMGYGELENIIKSYASQSSNIHFHPAVPFEDIFDYTSDADIGLSIIENSNLNHYFCLPNKLFEYALNGVPVAVSPFPDLSRTILELKAGWRIKPDYQNIYNFVNEIGQEDVLKMKKLLSTKNFEIGWHIEENTLINMYKGLNLEK